MGKPTISFSVPGEPVGKARPRVVGGHAFTPDKTKAYEEKVRLCYRAKAGADKMIPAGNPIFLHVTAWFVPPKSDTKAARENKLSGELRPCKKPDWDNIGKIISDALNGIAYHDDSQIVSAVVHKLYGATPRVEVEIYEL